MERQRIAVDCDDVIANINDNMRQFINDTFDFQHTAEDYRVDGEYHRYWERIWGIPEGESVDWFAQYVASGRMAELTPVEGALPALRALKDQYSLVMVTARSTLEVDYTVQWLERHAPELFDEVTFMHRWQRTPDHKVTKGEICHELKADYLIDDNYDHCRGAVAMGKQAILFGDYGWNRNYELQPNMIRAGDWQAVQEYFC